MWRTRNSSVEYTPPPCVPSSPSLRRARAVAPPPRRITSPHSSPSACTRLLVAALPAALAASSSTTVSRIARSFSSFSIAAAAGALERSSCSSGRRPSAPRRLPAACRTLSAEAFIRCSTHGGTAAPSSAASWPASHASTGAAPMNALPAVDPLPCCCAPAIDILSRCAPRPMRTVGASGVSAAAVSGPGAPPPHAAAASSSWSSCCCSSAASAPVVRAFLSASNPR
mmetsp:Transcript_63928/g.175512  ORF Transcript_63928/g.175512 Transcript_63928/m.175512 type:complete len:227 (+) Transcript_63928:3550-4230(+)